MDTSVSDGVGGLPAQDTEAVTDLKAGALGLPSVMMQSISHIAPAFGMILTIQFLVTLTGLTAPLACFVGVLLAFGVGITIVQLARYLPSAGGFYTYLSRAINPRVGFMVAWLAILFSPIVPGFDLPFTGLILQRSLSETYNITFPWWLFVIVAAVFLAFVAYRGITISARVMLVLGTLEIVVMVALALSGVVNPGPGGVTLDALNPGAIITTNGFFLAVVFSIMLLSGFESAAPLAEESRSPRRTVPLAIIGSLVILGVFLVVTSFGIMMGWGSGDLNGFTASTENPVFVLAKKLWGAAWILLPITLLNSTIAVCIASGNVATRMYWAMARDGAAPRFLRTIHPVYRTPVNAVWTQLALTLAIGLGLGALLGPENNFFTLALVQTLAAISMYVAGNAAVVVFYRREHREEFRLLLHFVLPMVTTIALMLVVYNSVVPLPAFPVGIAPIIFVLWFVAGLAILALARMRGREDWLLKAGRIAAEVPIPSEGD